MKGPSRDAGLRGHSVPQSELPTPRYKPGKADGERVEKSYAWKGPSLLGAAKCKNANL